MATMALRAAATGFLRPAAVPMCEGYTCLVPMLSAGFAGDIYNTFRFGACSATQELENPPCPFNLRETLREAGNKLSGSAFIPVDYLPKLRPEQDMHHILGGGAVIAGLVFMSEGEKNDDKGEPSPEVDIEVLKEKLSSVSEKAGHLEAENQKLRGKEGSKGAKGGDKAGKEGDKAGKEVEKEALHKKAYRYLKFPSMVVNIYNEVSKNVVMWLALGAWIPHASSLTAEDWKKVIAGEFKLLWTKVEKSQTYLKHEFPETRVCPCGVPWPLVCSRCGGKLPAFVEGPFVLDRGAGGAALRKGN